MTKEKENVQAEFASLCNCERTDGTHAVDCAAVLVFDSSEEVI